MTTPTHRYTSGIRATGILSAMVFITACTGAPFGMVVDDGNIRILEISSPDYHGAPGDPLEGACRAWTLSPQQADAFFRFSQPYPDAPYDRFYQVACGISGRLSADRRVWTFAINGGGTATWQDGDTVRHFGCAAPECEPLLLLPPDGMAPN